MKKPILVAEVGINHNGDLCKAKQLIDLAVKHGFDYVKFQKRDLDSCYTQEYLASARESPWGTTQRDQKAGLEFSIEEYEAINAYCKENGIKWFYSTWDVNSAMQMEKFDCDFVKVARASITNKVLREYLNRHNKKPVIISTNGYCYNELLDVNKFENIEYILQCSSLYPCPVEFSGLSRLNELAKLGCKVGYSNHCQDWMIPAIASYMGASMIEVHITLDKNMYGSDQKASLDDADLTNLVAHLSKPTSEIAIAAFIEKEKEVLQKLRQTW